MWSKLVGCFKARSFTWAFLFGTLLGGVLPDAVEGSADIVGAITTRAEEFQLNNLVVMVGLVGVIEYGYTLYRRLHHCNTNGVVKGVNL